MKCWVRHCVDDRPDEAAPDFSNGSINAQLPPVKQETNGSWMECH